MTRPHVVARVCCSLLIVLSTVAIAAAGQYVESFTTTTYRDPAGTTAFWDTGTGQLKLAAFTPSLVGAYDTPAQAISVAIAGNLALVADDVSGLQLIDITNPASPAPVGSYNTPGLALDVAVSGFLAFVADEASGLQIINIANPASPAFVGAYNTPGFALGVAVDGEIAFVADGFNGLVIIDVSNPAAPVLIKTFDTPGFAARVAVAGNHVFVADDATGVVIVSVTDPTSPVLAGTYNSPGSAFDVAVAGNHAFVADGTEGLQVVDITNPAAPTLVGNYNTPGSAGSVAVAGDVAFVADEAFGLQMINIINPAAPTLIHTVDTPGLALSVAVDGAFAFVADDAPGLAVFEVADPAYPRFLGYRGTPDYAYDVEADGDFAFVASGTAGLHIIGIENLSSMTSVGSYNTPGDAYAVAVAGDLAFVADGTAGLIVINIANPASPTLVGSYDTPGNASDVAVSGNLAFVADGNLGLQVISILNPATPTLVGTYDTPGNAGNLAVSGDLVLVCDALLNFGVRIIDVSNPATPVLLATYTGLGGPAGVTIKGDLAYVAFDSGLRIIDISNPAAPVLVGSIGFQSQDVVVAGDLAVVALYGGLAMVDVSNPADPTLISGYLTTGPSYGIAVQGEAAFVADGIWSLHVVEAFNHEFYTRDHRGLSLKINPTNDPIVAARLTSTHIPNVTWGITSAPLVGIYENIEPNNSWMSLEHEGNELRWLATFGLTTPGVNPTVSDLQIEWLYEFATIDAIADVPNDQGGFVRLHHTRSGRDLPTEPLPIIHYGVWRRVDDVALNAAIASGARDADPVDPSLAKAYPTLPLFRHDGRTFVESSRLHTTGTFPPGTWEWMATIPALQQHNYIATFPTEADTPSQVVLVVTAHTTTPSIWYASAADSGSSVDNIAPPVPTNLEADYNTGEGNTLAWDPSPAGDFATFRIYRSTDPGFTPSPLTLAHATTSTDWSDPDFDGGPMYYKVTAVDDAGNESGPATPGTVTSIGDPTIPQSAALYQNHPNPFNPTTQIRYDVPSAGADVELAIYDVSGRRVRTLVSRREDAGAKAIDWDGRDDAGATAATGVYFYRVVIGSFSDTRKMVLLK